MGGKILLVKLIVSIIILISTGIVGYLISLRYSLRVKEIGYMQTSITNLETEILYFSNSLPQAMEKVALRAHKSIANLFLDAYHYLESKEGYRIDEAWSNSVLKNSSQISLNKEDIEILFAFGKELGIGDKEVQKNHFGYIKILLEEQRIKAIADKDKNGSLYNRLGVLLGLVIVIILI